VCEMNGSFEGFDALACDYPYRNRSSNDVAQTAETTHLPFYPGFSDFGTPHSPSPSLGFQMIYVGRNPRSSFIHVYLCP
jgi:hypothetical protein